MHISRRRFLKNTIAGTTFLAASSLDLAALCQVSSGNNEDALRAGAADIPIKGEVVQPNNEKYDESRKEYNERFDIKPSAILYCQNEEDVKRAVKWARKNNVPVSIRSGGHSYEGFSLLEGGAVIDLSKIDGITVKKGKKAASIGAGVELMPFYEALWEQRRVVPAGSCATVGVAGLALGGGFGLLSRSMGLTCDNLLAVRLVDANGDVIEADAHKNSDLYWACRGGGGGNFGVVTELTFQLHPIGNVTVFSIGWQWQDMPHVISAWQNWLGHADDRITSVLTMTSKKANRLACFGVFLGTKGELTPLLKPIIDAAKPKRFTLSTMPFIDAARRFSGFKQPAKAPQQGTTQHEPVHHETVHHHLPNTRFKNTSDYVNKNLSGEAIALIIEHLTKSPRDSSCIQFDGYGGAINRVPIADTAFCHRGDTKFCIHYQVSWKSAHEDEANMNWVNEFRQAMQPFVSGYSYGNYCDRENKDWAHSYYGDNLNRLIEVKRKYDPSNFFQFEQSIPLANPQAKPKDEPQEESGENSPDKTAD